MRLRTLQTLTLLAGGASIIASISACGGGTTAMTDPNPGPSATVGCVGKPDAARVAISDLGTGCYLGFEGGLYPSGSNSVPAAHLAAGIAAASKIRPLDANGTPSASGNYVLLSIGMSNTTQEFCSEGGTLGSCLSVSFIAQAAADPAVNHSTLAIVNGAAGGKSADFWTSPTLSDYDRIRDSWLKPLDLSEKQVQIVWLKDANAQPKSSLPLPAADAYTLETELGQIARALKARYPNLRQLFVSSRTYGGYATSNLNPEPYAYESAFSVKWVVGSQIAEVASGAGDSRAGSLRYDTGTAPWIAWGPYLWANGTTARSDGLVWLPGDFSADGTHPAASGRQKVGAMLLAFFEQAPEAQCWFLAGRTCN